MRVEQFVHQMQKETARREEIKLKSQFIAIRNSAENKGSDNFAQNIS